MSRTKLRSSHVIVIIFGVLSLLFLPNWLWSFYLFLFTVSLLAIRLPCFNKLELSWVKMLYSWLKSAVDTACSLRCMNICSMLQLTRHVRDVGKAYTHCNTGMRWYWSNMNRPFWCTLVIGGTKGSTRKGNADDVECPTSQLHQPTRSSLTTITTVAATTFDFWFHRLLITEKFGKFYRPDALLATQQTASENKRINNKNNNKTFHVSLMKMNFCSRNF